MRLIVANPRGFCAGVERAVNVVDDLLDILPSPIFVRHEIVHNRVVTDRLASRGAVFVDDVEAIPRGSIAVMSAHGVAPAVIREAGERALRVIDATCPLVTRVQLEVVRQSAAGRSLIIIGHRGHIEVDGLIGHYDGPHPPQVIENEREAEDVEVPDPKALAYVTQTTLAVSQCRRIVSVLKRRFPQIVAPRTDTICYATQNRQDAVRALAVDADVIYVIGAPHSSNSRRLAEVAREEGRIAHLIERADEIAPGHLVGARSIGLTSSASAPEHLVEESVRRLSRMFPGLEVTSFGEAETLYFKPPGTFEQLRKETQIMNEETARTETLRTISFDGLADVVKAAGTLAKQLRETAESAGEIAEREVAMVVTIAEQARDKAISPQLLAEARQIKLLGELRTSAHQALDVGFDAAGAVFRIASDAIDTFLGDSRKTFRSVAG